MQEALKDYSALNDLQFFRNYLASKAEEMASEFDLTYSGVGVFWMLEIDHSNREVHEYGQTQDYEMIHLDHLTQSKTVLSNVFDLSYIADNQALKLNYYILDLNREVSNIYKYSQHDLMHIETMENTGLDEYDETNPAKRKENMGIQGWWNIGEDMYWIVEEDKHYLKDIASKINNTDKIDPLQLI